MPGLSRRQGFVKSKPSAVLNQDLGCASALLHTHAVTGHAKDTKPVALLHTYAVHRS